MDMLKKIEDISKNYYQYLMSLENVNGVGIGFKNINNINTFEPCIHVLVKNKVDSKYLTRNNIIPKYYMGIKTDVINGGNIVALSKEDEYEYEENEIPFKLRPLQSGCGISIRVQEGEKISGGTLGCIVTRVKDGVKSYYILSNNHVLTDTNQYPIGTPIVQPVADTNIDNVVGYLSNFMPIRMIKDFNIPPKKNNIDAALAEVSKYEVSNKIYDFGEIKGVSTPSLDLDVHKVGFTTGLTSGEITTMKATVIIHYENINQYALFQNQIIASDLETERGDSGSALLNDKKEVIGLVCSSILEDDLTICNEIDLVLKALHVEIYTGE